MLRRLVQSAMVLLGVASTLQAQTTISLRTSARLGEDAQDVRLADVAVISGGTGELSEVIVVDDLTEARRAGWLKLDVSDVRRSLSGVAGVNWGQIELRGGACTVRLGEPRLASRDESNRQQDQGRIRPGPVDLSGPPTVRSAVAAKLASVYGVSLDRLRLGFSPADQEVLDTLVGTRVVDVSPAGLGTSSRLPVTVTLYEGERVPLTRTIQVSAQVYRPVVVASTTIERGRAIMADHVSVVDQWVTPGDRSASSLDQVLDAAAQKRIGPGETVRLEDVAAPLACKRGDTVYVHCVSGSVVVRLKARALGSARDGELVQLKADTSEAPFTARMSGRGRAVITTIGTEQRLGEDDPRTTNQRNGR
ncbi:MAG: flagellar basal body P-ring formation chaperone FlgA [Phycisphaerales bacterium]